MGITQVHVRPLGKPWQAIGTLRDRGIWHEGLEAVSDQWGPKTCTFTLKRSARALFPDLLTHTPVMVTAAGQVVWRGRISTTPETNGPDRQISVECVGAQAILDDDKFEQILVHNDLTAYRDTRSFLTADLTKFIAAGSTTTDGGIVIGFPQGSVVALGQAAGVLLDLGPPSAAKRIVMTWENKGVAASTYGLYVVGVDTPSDLIVAGENAVAGIDPASAASPAAGTFSAARRYIGIILYRNTTGTTETADRFVRITGMQTFEATAFESGNASALSAKLIIADALGRGTTGLNADQSQIGDPAFAFPNFAPDGPKTPREVIAAANAPHNWQFKIDEQLRPVFRARPTAPTVDLGAWLGSESDQGATNSDEGITTKVIVRGTGPDGSPVRSTRTQTGTIVDRQGDAATTTLDSSYLLTSPFADRLGDTYLAGHRVSPFKGEVVITRGGARRTSGGAGILPAVLLTMTGQLARRTDLIDPDAASVGRNVTIDQVTYSDDAETATIALDNTNDAFDSLQARLGYLVPAG